MTHTPHNETPSWEEATLKNFWEDMPYTKCVVFESLEELRFNDFESHLLVKLSEAEQRARKEVTEEIETAHTNWEGVAERRGYERALREVKVIADRLEEHRVKRHNGEDDYQGLVSVLVKLASLLTELQKNTLATELRKEV